jgi:uncharacterized membrane protein YdbT with pleckstrin-like domain
MTTERPPQKRSLFRLLADIPSLLTQLVREEIDNLKQELLGKLKAAGIGIGLLAGAAFFALFALMVLITAAIAGLATVWPVWLAALVVAAALLVIVAILALAGISSLKRGVPPAPTETIESVKRDVRVIKGTARRTEDLG